VDHAGVEIGQPTSFFVGCALNLTPKDIEGEIKILRRKIKAGADFILTQPIYRPEEAKKVLGRYEERYGPLEVPILVGVLPLYGLRHAAFLHNEVPGIDIPEFIQSRLKGAGEQAPYEGVKIALELIEEMRAWSAGVYLMPAFKRYDLVAEIIEGVKS
jgi:homocysteine S-methyltransferase